MGKSARKKAKEENEHLKNKYEEFKAEIEALKAENVRLKNEKEGLNVQIMALTTENENVRKERTEAESKNKLKAARQEELMKEMINKVGGEDYRKMVDEINGKMEQLKNSICNKDKKMKELEEDLIRLARLSLARLSGS